MLAQENTRVNNFNISKYFIAVSLSVAEIMDANLLFEVSGGYETSQPGKTSDSFSKPEYNRTLASSWS